MAFNAGYSAQIIAEVKLTPSAVPAFNISVETFTTPAPIATILPEQQIRVEGEAALPAGLILLSSRCNGTAGTLELVFENVSGATITPVAQNFKLLAF